jgi:hypothetical protein
MYITSCPINVVQRPNALFMGPTVGGPWAVTYAWLELAYEIRGRRGLKTYLGHSTIDHEFGSVNEAALIAGEE